MGKTMARYGAPVVLLFLAVVAACVPSATARVVQARQLLFRVDDQIVPTPSPTSDADLIPLWYPGRPKGICTSRGHTCDSLMVGKPFHVLQEGRCGAARGKTVRDRFGRPLTMRFTYNKQVYVAN